MKVMLVVLENQTPKLFIIAERSILNIHETLVGQMVGEKKKAL